MRIMTTACAGLLIGALSIAYGLDEQTEEVARDIAALEQRKEALQRELDVLAYEMRAATAPDRLTRVAASAFGADQLRDAAGAPLAPWRTDQLLELGPPSAAFGFAPGPLTADVAATPPGEASASRLGAGAAGRLETGAPP